MRNKDIDIQEDMQFKYGIPREEMDEPLEFVTRNKMIEPLEAQRLRSQEKDKERKERRYFSAFKLIVGCLIFLGAIYVVDVVMSALLNKALSGVTDAIIEIIKTLLFTLSGYLFARKENGD